MKTIWKYKIFPEEKQQISIPEGAKILDVQMQRGVPCVWALVDPDAEHEIRTLVARGTGRPIITRPGEYIGTFQMAGGDLMLHLFDIT